ncbi:MAG: sensor histidine kinase [Gammaproteobacteria bacterium]
MLFQALCNLLDNAIKYSESGTVVVLESHQLDDQIRISVADRGPGIPPDEYDKVLDRFYRSASVTGVPGSGLGLALVNAIAHHHGGKLELNDNKPGLRVTLTLPLNSGATQGLPGVVAPEATA